MNFDDEPPKGETLPPQLIRSLAIPNFGRGWLAKNKAYNGDQLVAGLVLITSNSGEDTRIDGFNAFVMGPSFDVAVSLATLFPNVSWPSPQSALISWNEKPVDIPFNTNTWMTGWRAGVPDIDRGDIFLSTEGKDVLKNGRDQTQTEKEHTHEQSTSTADSKVPIEFSYTFFSMSLISNMS